MPTDFQRMGSGRKHGDLVFTPGDDTKPPLLTVAIGPTPESRKEIIPMNLETPTVDNATIRARIEAGEDLHAIATALQVPFTRVRAIHAALQKQARHGKTAAIDPATKQHALSLLDAGLSAAAVAEEMGVSKVTIYRWKQDAVNPGLASEAKPAPPAETEPKSFPVKARVTHAGRMEPVDTTPDPKSETDAPQADGHFAGLDALLHRETRADPAFRIVLDPESAQKAFAAAVGAWVQAHLTTSFDGQTGRIHVPPLPTRWVVQAQAITMAPEEDNA